MGHSGTAATDRLLIALVFAAAIHALVIFGIDVAAPTPKTIKKSLSITLVRTPSRVAPKQAEYLAEADQFGGGKSRKESSPNSAPVPPAPAVTPAPLPAPSPPELLPAEPQPPVRRREVMTRQRAEKKVAAEAGEAARPQAAPQRQSLETLSRQIDEISEQLNRNLEMDAMGPRVLFINSVNSRRYKAAAYERAWQEKVERIGNLNYPEEAREQHLSGSLVLAVWIRQDGSVDQVQVRQSSGHALLDEAAQRIVRLSSPFTAFPPELKKEADLLVITRTWRFYDQYRFTTE